MTRTEPDCVQGARRRAAGVAAVVLIALAWAGAAAPRGSESHEPQAGQKTPSPAKAATSPETLDALLAPIALYPDQLLGQILLCAANPNKVAALQEWLAAKDAVTGSELQNAAAAAGFEPSFVALVLFPTVVDAMANDLKWTAELGRAFAADRSAVFASIQRLRGKAQATGTLKDTPQQDVSTRTTESGQQVIVIEPANPQIVYVPQYNPQVVYTQPTSSTVVVQSDSSSDAAVAAGLIGFTAGIAIGAAIDNDYYYGPYGWGGGVYMYDDAWDDWSDAREDAREDWQDHREDLADERGDRAGDAQEQRTDRQQTAQEQRTDRQQTRQDASPEAQAQREQRRADAQSAAGQAKASGTTQESRGYSRDASQPKAERSGTRSDAFSGYSSGRSERAAKERGQRSRGSSGGGRRR